jgi:hypothetical protein
MLVPYFEYFDQVTQFEILVSGGSDLSAVLLVRNAAVLAQRSFGRQTVWVGKWCPIGLIFGQCAGNIYVYFFMKFCAVWICGLRAFC